MNVVKNWKLRTKLVVGFMAVAIVAGMMAYLGQRWAFAKIDQETLSTLLGTGSDIIFFFVAISIFAIIGGIFLAKIMIEPVLGLIATTQRFAAGDYSARADVGTQHEVGELARAFNAMAEDLRTRETELQSIAQKLEQRTHALEVSADIGRQMTVLLDLDKLLNYVVNQIRTEFDFYHTHIFLVDESSGDLVVAEGSGEVGQQLKAQAFRLALGQGIIGTVANTKQTFLSNNVEQIPNFEHNPLLPDTKSELAVPLRRGDQILGVLDVQSKQLERFSSDDETLLQALADQLAVAIDNVRLVAKTHEALRQVERLNKRMLHEAWSETQKEVMATGYRFSRGRSQALAPGVEAWLPPMKEAAVKRQLVKHSHSGNGDKPKTELALPLILRGEVIGVLGVKREAKPDWAEEEVSAVTAVADQISRALENARLSKEQEKTIEQLKEIDRLKSEFLTSMSHELRTPLNSIIGFADVLLQGIDGDLPDLAMNDIKLIHNSGQHLLALINDILDLSKIEAGKMELVREPLDIGEVIDDALAASTSLVKNKPVEIKIDRPESLPLIYADKLRLSQVLLNLMSNAAKFTERGSITIKAGLSADSPGKMRIAVVDTGVGIPEQKLEAIFDRFRQADSSTTRKYGGTGLGLAIALNLTEMHEGELKVKSQEGMGSEFYFTIPIADSINENSEEVVNV